MIAKATTLDEKNHSGLHVKKGSHDKVPLKSRRDVRVTHLSPIHFNEILIPLPTTGSGFDRIAQSTRLGL